MSRESKVYFLTKPFDSKALLELVNKAVNFKKSSGPSPDILQQKWLSSFMKAMEDLSKSHVSSEPIDRFLQWNFESVTLQFFVKDNDQIMMVNLLMKQKTFLKIAGKLQGTQYNEIEPENLVMWEEMIKRTFDGTSSVIFSKVLSQDILFHPGRSFQCLKCNSALGEILLYLN